MNNLGHTRVYRTALSKTTRRYRNPHVVVGHTNYVDKDDSGYLHLVHDIRAGKGWSVRDIAIEHKDFGLIIDHMMGAHPEATVRAIGAVLARFGQTV